DAIGLERYLDVLRVNLSFGKVFLPPIGNRGALRLPGHTRQLLDPERVEMLERQYEQGQEPPVIFRDSLLKDIKAALLRNAKLAYFWEGLLPDGVFMTVDGEPLLTDRLWPLVASRIDHASKDIALREAIVSLAFDQDLRAKGALLTRDQARELYRQH